MRTLQTLLTILNGQKLTPGYLPVLGDGTALGHLIELKKTYEPTQLPQGPTPYNFPSLLFTPAWIASLGAGQDAIFLHGVDGMRDLSHSQQPAYKFGS